MKDLTIHFILDKSGSMQSIWDDAIGGFNAFRSKQVSEPGRTLLSLTLFDNTVAEAHPALPIAEIADLTRATYVPSGGTALYDAIGSTIERAQGTEIAGVPLVVVLTDGLENASRRFTRASLAALISAKKLTGWEFLYLGTTPENWADAEAIGAAPMSFRADAAGTAGAFAAAAQHAAAVRRK